MYVSPMLVCKTHNSNAISIQYLILFHFTLGIIPNAFKIHSSESMMQISMWDAKKLEVLQMQQPQLPMKPELTSNEAAAASKPITAFLPYATPLT